MAIIVYLTIEYFEKDVFSGNGIAARSHVRGLAKKGYRVHVIAGRPRRAQPPTAADSPGKTTFDACPLDIWYTTDRHADHVTFARAAASALERFVAESDYATLSSVRAVMAVDWTGDAAIEAMNADARARLTAASPIMFLNFRLYCRMAGISAEDVTWYRECESAAVRRAIRSGGGVMSLSHSDNAELQAMDDTAGPSKAFKVIYPMLRQEFLDIAERERNAILGTTRRQKFFACIVRLSADKGASRFVDICEAMMLRDPLIWEKSGVVPLMAGAASQPKFAAALKKRFKRVIPCGIIVDEFLRPPQLAQLLFESALNVHPALYEAWGMTIVEAGSCGVPSLIHREGIGAEELLKPSDGASIAVDMEDTTGHVADLCAKLLTSPSGLEELRCVGRKAFFAATSWSEDAHVRTLIQLVDNSDRYVATST
jgi:glycosyltransferase involved in cell wall biosynthesis